MNAGARRSAEGIVSAGAGALNGAAADAGEGGSGATAGTADAVSGRGVDANCDAVRDLVRREDALSDLGLVLDDVRRSAAFGRPMVLERLRYKPGTSIVAALRDERGDRHWVVSYSSVSKLEKIARHIEQMGGEAALLTGRTLTGPAYSDRLLGPVLTELFGPDEPRYGGGSVLRYNPLRRMVLRRGDLALKIAAAKAPNDAAVALAERGLPVLAPRRVRDGVTAVPWWGMADLARRHDTELERLAGAALAAIHRVPPEGLVRPGPDPAETAAESTAAIAGLLPGLAARAWRLADRLGERMEPATGVLVHGDWSPDQVLTDGHAIRIIDFDRAAIAPAERDLGSYLACGGSATMLDGYRDAGGNVDPSGLALWRSLATLQRAVEPFRTGAADWPIRVERALADAEEALE